MNKYIKTVATISLCVLCIPAMAADRFIVKYKLNEPQKAFLSSHSGTDADAQKAEAKIRKDLMEKLSKEQLDALSKAAKVQVVDSRPLATGAHVIASSEDLDETQTKQFIDNVKQDNNIEYIEEDKELKASLASENPAYQWDMTGPGGFSAKPIWEGDGFTKAWSILNNYGYVPGKNVVVAVLDTGYTQHPNFVNNLQLLNGQAGVYGYKFISDCRKSGECPACTINARNDPHSKYTQDGLDLGDFVSAGDINCPIFQRAKKVVSSWHGSHVIGTIISNGYNKTNNPDYMTGGAYGATVVPVRVLGKGGGSISDITDGMMWAAGLVVPNTDGLFVPVNQNPAQVISMSLGSIGQCSKLFQDAINAVVRRGAIVVVAAGNDHVNIKDTYPSSCNGVIAVAAKGPTGQLAPYSNFGDTTIAASGGDDTISNPLSMIKSTVWSSLEEYQTPTNGGRGIWKEMQGTSMATPHVSAAIAILIGIFKAQGKPYTNKDIIEILQKSATEYSECNGHGCTTDYALDVYNAVNNVLVPDCIQWFYSILPSSKTVTTIVPTMVLSAVIGGVTVYCYMRR